MIDIEALAGDLVPGPGPTDKLGSVITVPFGTVAASQTVVSFACKLMGWSVRESTGVSGAVAEWVDGGDDNGAFIAALDVDRAVGSAANSSPLQATQTVANAVLNATLIAPAGATIAVTTLRITGTGATAATEVDATLQGVLGGTVHYPINVPAGAAVPIVPVEDNFGPNGLQNSAAGTNIFINVPAFGAGNAEVSAELNGFVIVPAVVADTVWLGPDGLIVTAGLRLRVISGSVRGAAWIRR